MRKVLEVIWVSWKQKYFCKWDWTGQITLIRFNNFSRARTTMPSSLPCRVVWGDKDKFIPVKFAHAFGAKQITIVPGAGHWVALTAPETLALAVEALG
jgi:pimeloyl-ACP methyl ester carboxylesterase